MRRMTLYGILCGILFTNTWSCKKAIELPSIEISTSGCYESCPILDIKLEGDMLYYNLVRFNDKNGTYRCKLNDDELTKISRLFSLIVIDSLKKEYVSYRNDMQIYSTKIISKGTSKRVYYYDNDAPEEYENLVDYLIDLRKGNLIKIDSTLNISTRKEVELLKFPVPPMPSDGASVSK